MCVRSVVMRQGLSPSTAAASAVRNDPPDKLAHLHNAHRQARGYEGAAIRLALSLKEITSRCRLGRPALLTVAGRHVGDNRRGQGAVAFS
jgi:hypothetical protein